MDRDSAIQPLNKRGQVELEIGNVSFWGGGRTRVLGETTPHPQRENQQQFIYLFIHLLKIRLAVWQVCQQKNNMSPTRLNTRHKKNL